MNIENLLRMYTDKMLQGTLIVINEKLKEFGFDITKRGKVISVERNTAIVEINGEKYTCKLSRGINIAKNDIVYVKFPQNNDSDKYIETILGINEITETINITPEEILSKLLTVDGTGSGLDADLLDGKHASEFATLDDIGNIDISGDTIVQNINSSTSIIDDKNLSTNVNDAISKKHTHNNKSIIDTITQTLTNAWDSAATHVSDTIKHITSGERTLLNTVSSKADKTYVDSELSKKLEKNQKGVANGLAELDSSGHVPSTQLPSYVDDVLEYPSRPNFPSIGESGKIYVAIDTNKTYRWTGSTYTIIGTDLALGETSSTAYRGDRGKIAYDHSQAPHNYEPANSNIQSHISSKNNPHGVTKDQVGLENVDNTSDLNKPISTATQIELDIRNIPFVVGTQTVTTSSWTGIANNIKSLTNGTTIRYWLPRTSTSTSVTLDLTLADGSTTGAIPCYYGGTSRLTTHYSSGSIILLTYIENQLINGTAYTGWYAHAQYNTTYSVISEAEIDAGTATSSRVISAIRLKYITDKMQVLLDGKVDNSRVLTDVPTNAKFTDTIYAHPLTHPASMISGLHDVATSGNYENLNNKPFIPTTVRQLTNDANYETITGAQTKANIAEQNAKSYTDIKVADIVNSAPEALDTLHELAEALGNDPNFATSMANEIGTKASKNYVDNELNKKVDEITLGDKVRNTLLTGLSIVTNAAISASDSILTALGKLQNQINAKQDNLGFVPANKSGETFEGKVNLPAGNASEAPLNIPHGVAPTTPTNGDIWSTTSGLLARINGTTRTLAHTSQWSLISQAEAEAGTATTARLISAQRLKQAIDKFKPQDTSELTKSDVYTKPEIESMLANAGQGDMMKSVYDTDNDGKVDVAENAEKFDGQLPSYYAKSSDIPSEFYHVGDTPPSDNNILWINTNL